MAIEKWSWGKFAKEIRDKFKKQEQEEQRKKLEAKVRRNSRPPWVKKKA